MHPDKGKRLTYRGHWFHFWMPYLFQKIPSARRAHVYLPLNRNYKPIGYTKEEWVKYEDYIDQAVVFLRDPHDFEDIWTSTTPEKLLLYDDDPMTRANYCERFDRLMAHKNLLWPFAVNPRLTRSAA